MKWMLAVCVLALVLGGRSGGSMIAEAQSWGWGKGVADECDDELAGALFRDIDSLPPDALRNDAHIDALFHAVSKMIGWCQANLPQCSKQKHEVQQRGCSVNPGIVSYRLNSRDASWEIQCSNNTLMLPADCR